MRRALLIAVAVVVMSALGAFVVVRGGDDDDPPSASPFTAPTTTTTSVPVVVDGPPDSLFATWVEKELPNHEYVGRCDDVPREPDDDRRVCHIARGMAGDDPWFELDAPDSDATFARLLVSRSGGAWTTVGEEDMSGADLDAAHGVEAVGRFLRAWWARDRAAMEELATPAAIDGFEPPRGQWVQFLLRAYTDECVLGPDGRGGCGFALVSRNGGGFNFKATYGENAEGKIVIDAFEPLGGGM